MNLAKTILIAAGLSLIILGFYLWRPADNNLPWRANVTINEEKFTVELADTKEAQVQGLSGRDYLPLNHGMLFLYNDQEVRHFWMKDMKFNIDILWIDGDTIVGFEENVPMPELQTSDEDLPVFSSLQPIDKVLEFSAGTIGHHSIKAGDKIYFDIYDRR